QPSLAPVSPVYPSLVLPVFPNAFPVPPSSPGSPRSLVRWHIEVLAEGSFRHTPTLQLLLVTAGSLGTIGDGAFAGLVLLEYLFIEDNEVGTIEPTALRGLRGLLFLSLANNRLETLPQGLFQGLETLSHLDLRGNPFRCDCRLRWLLSWLGTVPSSPETAGRCRSPSPHQGTPLAHLDPQDFQCQRAELRPFQSLPFSSLGAESFTLGGHQGVALAQPFAGACALLEWDQLAGRFRAPTIINSESGGTQNPPWVMRWEGSMFREIQQVPARGSMIFQPLTLSGHRYVLLGNDFALSRVFRLGPEGHLEPTQELLVPTPRAFVPVTIGQWHFLVASSFKGATQIYQHMTIDLEA
ncbi:leucine-rich repeat LGI family member 4-like, partial [Manacus vitellinus]|uniref:leucine-rich repeat LGI family member 4-like n=1 Tax=Manacus vitellinus TaxID=328815 RepID=UPI00115F096B